MCFKEVHALWVCDEDGEEDERPRGARQRVRLQIQVSSTWDPNRPDSQEKKETFLYLAHKLVRFCSLKRCEFKLFYFVFYTTFFFPLLHFSLHLNFSLFFQAANHSPPRHHTTCIVLALYLYILYVKEVVTQPKILKRTILYNLVHVT